MGRLVYLEDEEIEKIKNMYERCLNSSALGNTKAKQKAFEKEMKPLINKLSQPQEKCKWRHLAED